EPHDEQVRAVAEEHLRDPRRVASGRELHDDADHRDGDPEDGGDDLGEVAERVLGRVRVVAEELAQEGHAAGDPTVEDVEAQEDRGGNASEREDGDQPDAVPLQPHPERILTYSTTSLIFMLPCPEPQKWSQITV